MAAAACAPAWLAAASGAAAALLDAPDAGLSNPSLMIKENLLETGGGCGGRGWSEIAAAARKASPRPRPNRTTCLRSPPAVMKILDLIRKCRRFEPGNQRHIGDRGIWIGRRAGVLSHATLDALGGAIPLDRAGRPRPAGALAEGPILPEPGRTLAEAAGPAVAIACFGIVTASSVEVLGRAESHGWSRSRRTARRSRNPNRRMICLHLRRIEPTPENPETASQIPAGR